MGRLCQNEGMLQRALIISLLAHVCILLWSAISEPAGSGKPRVLEASLREHSAILPNEPLSQAPLSRKQGATGRAAKESSFPHTRRENRGRAPELIEATSPVSADNRLSEEALRVYRLALGRELLRLRRTNPGLGGLPLRRMVFTVALSESGPARIGSGDSVDAELFLRLLEQALATTEVPRALHGKLFTLDLVFEAGESE